MIKNSVIHIIQWMIIILLSIFCFYFWRTSKVSNKHLIQDVQFQKNEKQYVAITTDKSLNELKKENAELYDSIKKLSDVKQGIQIKYVTRYKTDTIHISENIKPIDSIYHYTQDTDTINYDLKIKANEVKWFTLDISMKDSLMLITRSKNGQNETVISHGGNTVITNATVFTPKKNFSTKVKDRVYYGVGVGVGYGFINKKTDIYIGANIGIKF